MKLLPLLDRVIVKANNVEEKTPSGLYIPDVAKEKPMVGEIIAKGEGKTENGILVSLKVKVGDKVLYGKYSGTEINFNNEECLIMRESDIFAIIED